MADMEIKIIVGESLGDIKERFDKVDTTNTQEAFRSASQIIASVWKMYARGTPIEGTSLRIKNPTGEYARSIKIRFKGKFDFEIYSDDPKALAIENGSPEVDLKKIIPYGRKSRVGKNGPYSIVPFRRFTPGRGRASTQLPENLYRKLRVAIKRGDFQRSKVLEEVRFEKNARGELVPRRTYAWGSRLSEAAAPTENLQGLVAIETIGGAPKGTPRSAYFTFRVITARKPKNYDESLRGKAWEDTWKVPSKEGLHLTEHVKRNTEEIIVEIIESAIQKDLGV